MELIEYERTEYIKEMEGYLYKLKQMPKQEAVKNQGKI